MADPMPAVSQSMLEDYRCIVRIHPFVLIFKVIPFIKNLDLDIVISIHLLVSKYHQKILTSNITNEFSTFHSV